MQLNYSIKKGTSILLCLCLFSFAVGMEAVGMEEKEFNYTNIKVIKEEIEDHLKKHSRLLDSSHNKDIVVFLGNSGAGKSTLINYLSEKGLKFTRFGKIILEDPGDPCAMAIGGGGTSETHLPGYIYIQENDLLFYDLPGFKDTRGTATNLANACFIQNIIENAKSVKLVCVARRDQLTSERGTSFYGFLDDVKRLIPNQRIEDFSALIITNSALNREDLGRYLLEYDLLLKSDLILKSWIENGQISQMSKPDREGINQSDRSYILNVIENIKPQKIERIDVGVIYNAEDRSRIKRIYDEEIQKIIDRLINENILPEKQEIIDKLVNRSPAKLNSSSQSSTINSDDREKIELYQKRKDEHDQQRLKRHNDLAESEAGQGNEGLSLFHQSEIVSILDEQDDRFLALSIENGLNNDNIRLNGLAIGNQASEDFHNSSNENVLSETFSSLSIENLKKRKEYLQINFYPQGSSDFEKSTLLNFLKPISVHTYDQSQKEMERLLQNKRILLLSRINCEIMERDRADAKEQKEQADKERNDTQVKLDETKKLTSEAETKNVLLESNNQALIEQINPLKKEKAEITKLIIHGKTEIKQVLMHKKKIEEKQFVCDLQYNKAISSEVKYWNFHRNLELFSLLPEGEQRKIKERLKKAEEEWSRNSSPHNERTGWSIHGERL